MSDSLVKDVRGIEIKPGDVIVYATRRGSNTYQNPATVVDVKSDVVIAARADGYKVRLKSFGTIAVVSPSAVGVGAGGKITKLPAPVAESGVGSNRREDTSDFATGYRG